MNPPDYYPVPASILRVFEAACKKYIASQKATKEGLELVVGWLIGGDWIDCRQVESILVSNPKEAGYFEKGCVNIMPQPYEILNKKQDARSSYYLFQSENQLVKYLNEPS